MSSAWSPFVSNAVYDIASTLSLSGSPGSVSDLHRKHLDRLGDTVNALFKSAQAVVSVLRGSHGGSHESCDSTQTPFELIFGQPGSTLDKQRMHTSVIIAPSSSSKLLPKWLYGPKAREMGTKGTRTLFTREIGLMVGRENPWKKGDGTRVLVKAGIVSENSLPH